MLDERIDVASARVAALDSAAGPREAGPSTWPRSDSAALASAARLAAGSQQPSPVRLSAGGAAAPPGRSRSSSAVGSCCPIPLPPAAATSQLVPSSRGTWNPGQEEVARLRRSFGHGASEQPASPANEKPPAARTPQTAASKATSVQAEIERWVGRSGVVPPMVREAAFLPETSLQDEKGGKIPVARVAPPSGFPAAPPSSRQTSCSSLVSGVSNTSAGGGGGGAAVAARTVSPVPLSAVPSGLLDELVRGVRCLSPHPVHPP